MNKKEEKLIKKVNHIMKFIGQLDRCTKDGFEKLCKEKEIKL